MSVSLFSSPEDMMRLSSISKKRWNSTQTSHSPINTSATPTSIKKNIVKALHSSKKRQTWLRIISPTKQISRVPGEAVRNLQPGVGEGMKL